LGEKTPQLIKDRYVRIEKGCFNCTRYTAYRWEHDNQDHVRNKEKAAAVYATPQLDIIYYFLYYQQYDPVLVSGEIK
jgi:hypothetical protein